MLNPEVRDALERGEVLPPSIAISKYPIGASLNILGRKWILQVLRDIGMRKIEHFNRLLKSIEGTSSRILSSRLRELEKAGLLRTVEEQTFKGVRWKFIEKGWGAHAILMSRTPSARTGILSRFSLTDTEGDD